MDNAHQNLEEIQGRLILEKETPRFFRYRICVNTVNVVGTLYFPKDLEKLPDRLILGRLEE
jgi:hypothetical protein